MQVWHLHAYPHDIEQSDLYLDIYLSPHVDLLFALIREKAILLYLKAYSVVNLLSMAKIFFRSAAELEEDLVALILSGKVNARINRCSAVFCLLHGAMYNFIHSQTIHTFSIDKRVLMHEKLLDFSADYCHRAKMLLLRTRMLRAGIMG